MNTNPFNSHVGVLLAPPSRIFKSNKDRRLNRRLVKIEKKSRARGSRRDPGQRRRYFERLIDERHIRTVLGLAYQGWDRGYFR